MTGKKANILTDNLGWILLALLLAIIFVLASPGIAEGFENAIKFLRNWR
ncbi:hypothetical protein J4234_00380 [Candidatus Woesearchaeota archaeon]|nr:hypothetical protein [Candidatus Woesearchaeota archaeon]